MTEYRKDTKMKSTFLKNGVSGIGGNPLNAGMASQFNNPMMTSNVKRIMPEDEVLPSE